MQSGFVALHNGEPRKAAEICRRALAEQPDMARAHYLAAMIAIEGNNHEMAVQALETTVRLNKEYAAAWARLAQVYLMVGRFMLAEESLRNAANTVRGNPATLDLIGTVFRQAGNLTESKQWHLKAVESDRGHPPFLINLANSHRYHGETEAAAMCLRDCLELEPDNAQVHWMIAGLETANTTAHVESMQRLLEAPLPNRSVAYLQYAIGKEYEDLGRWDDAFDAWSAGAAARRRTIASDESRETQLFEILESRFTEEWLDDQHSECSNAGPIFIVGEPRSGTTLLDRMLDAHPAVMSAGELRHFGYAVRRVVDVHEPHQFTAELMTAASDADMTAIGNAYIESTAVLRGEAPNVIDKLPSNYLYLPLILSALPNAKVIHLRRDSMDACLAIFKQLFADAYLYSYDLGELGRHYARYLRLMQTLRERFGARFTEVWYEDLVLDTEETLRSVLQSIDLSWNAACLESHERVAGVATPSATQVREMPHARSIGHWRDFENQLKSVQALVCADALNSRGS